MNKKLMLALIATTMCFFIACNDGTSTTETKDTATVSNTDVGIDDKKMENDMMTPMSMMMDKMKAIKMTEDFDHDFATLMIDHHQGAVDISEMALAKTSDAQIKTMAQTMVTDHKSEIEELRNF